MRIIALKLPKNVIQESKRLADTLSLSRADYIRMAIRRLNRKTAARLRAERLTEVSKHVREESMKVNEEFATFERDPNAHGKAHFSGGGDYRRHHAARR